MKYLEYLILAIAIVELMMIRLAQVLTFKIGGKLSKSGIQNAALWWVAVYVLHYIQRV